MNSARTHKLVYEHTSIGRKT